MLSTLYVRCQSVVLSVTRLVVGMSSDALKVIYKSVVVTKLLYASPAWWGFTTSADKQWLEAFLSRGVRLNLYSALDPSVSQRVQDTDDELFSAVMGTLITCYNTCYLTVPLIHILSDLADMTVH